MRLSVENDTVLKVIEHLSQVSILSLEVGFFVNVSVSVHFLTFPRGDVLRCAYISILEQKSEAVNPFSIFPRKSFRLGFGSSW